MQSARPPQQAHPAPGGYPPNGGSRAVEAPKKRKKWPIVVACLVLIPLLLVGVWAGYFFIPPKGPGSLEKQWESMKAQVPNGQVVALELREGPPHGERGVWKKVDWLDAYWLEGARTHYLSRHPYDKDESGVVSHISLSGYQNVDITSEDLEKFQSFTDTISCDKDDFRATRMLKLPDGFPIFSGTCSNGWNNAMEEDDKVVLGDEPYDPQTTMDVIVAAAKIGSHMDFELAKLTLESKSVVVANSCITDGESSYSLVASCSKNVLVRARDKWPRVIEGSNKATGFDWPAEFEALKPSDLGSKPLDPAVLDKAKLEACFKTLAAAGIKVGDAATQIVVVSYQDGFAIVVYQLHTKKFLAIDQDGNVISR